MIKKLALTALSFALAFAFAVPAQAEIVDYGTSYGYGSTMPGYTGASFVTISRDLTIGSYGADVAALESFLRARGYLTVQGTGYFSAATRDAVARFQATNGIFPASGYFGPLTRAYYNAQAATFQYQQYPYGTQYQYQYQTQYPYQFTYQTGCPSGYSAVNYGGQVGCLPNSSFDDDDDDLNGDDAELRDFSIDEGDDAEAQEGDNDAEILRISFEVEDGDVEIDRVEVRFESISGRNRPWDVFESIRLLGDGDEIAEIDTDDDDAWDRDGNGYVLRFDDLDRYIVDEGDEADLTLEADIANIDFQSYAREEWELSVPDDGIRALDGDGDRLEIGDEDEVVELSITS